MGQSAESSERWHLSNVFKGTICIRISLKGQHPSKMPDSVKQKAAAERRVRCGFNELVVPGEWMHLKLGSCTTALKCTELRTKPHFTLRTPETPQHHRVISL